MKKASIRDLHIRTSELVRVSAEGAVIQTERRREVVAELRPLRKKPLKPRLPRMREVWSRLPSVATDSGRFLEEDR